MGLVVIKIIIRKNWEKILKIFFLLVVLSFSTWSIKNLKFETKKKASEIPNQPIRGQLGDLWADIEVGRRDFTEISPLEVVSYKLFNPGGVIVDRSANPGRMYVWDSGNNRILGVDLGKCYNSNPPCSADIIFGQPSASDYGACNLDSSFQTYPDRPPSSASTLCGISERTHTVLEDKTGVSMDVDSQGNLYVPDAMNNRVLKYIKPFETDTVADEVLGQPDFQSNRCNLTGSTYGDYNAPSPTASTLCFCSQGSCGLGVTLDPEGNLWVADGGNNRVLRFPKDLTTRQIGKTADLVLGQPDFTTGGDWSYGSDLNKMHQPVAVTFDKSGKLYVADSENRRILVFDPPFSSGMNARMTFGSFENGTVSVKVDKDPSDRANEVVWTTENMGWNAVIKMWNPNGTLRKTLTGFSENTLGSIGIDTENNLLVADYIGAQDIHVIRLKPDGNYERYRELFSPPLGYNKISEKRFAAGAWVGVTVTANQLIVGESRLLFWNNPPFLTNGQTPDGYVGASSFTEYPDPPFTQLKSDSVGRVWANKHSEIWIYQAPLTVGSQPIKKIVSPLSVLGGGKIILDSEKNIVFGLAPTADGKFLWISQPDKNRVLRIRNPLDRPLVDIILGQINLSGSQCNQGKIPENGLNPYLSMLCYPGNLSIDKKGNLYVSDHPIEGVGNNRVLLFAKNLFPDNPQAVIFAPNASKEFRPANLFEPAFDSTNRMVAGGNPYDHSRFLDYFNDPTMVNPRNPSDPNYAIPDGQLKDFYGWPIAATFDNNDNLYVYDANRGKVMIYKHPFSNTTPSVIPTFTPTPTSVLAKCNEVCPWVIKSPTCKPCENGLIYWPPLSPMRRVDSFCRNPVCPNVTNCQCPTPTLF